MDTQEWLEVHRLAHSIGMKTTATMMFGTVETDEEIIEHWELLRNLQDKTGGFRAFIMWSFQGANTQLKAEIPDIKPQSSNRYLRLLAVARLYLDNFKLVNVTKDGKNIDMDKHPIIRTALDASLKTLEKDPILELKDFSFVEDIKIDKGKFMVYK